MKALLLLPLALSGCWLTSQVVGTSSSEWYDLAVVAKDPGEVARIARDVLIRQGFRVLPAKPAALSIETDWEVHLSSHWREGFRIKVEIEIEKTEDGRSIPRVRSYREINEDGKNPLSGKGAIWAAASLDDKQRPKMGEPAMRTRELLRMKLEGLP